MQVMAKSTCGTCLRARSCTQSEIHTTCICYLKFVEPLGGFVDSTTGFALPGPIDDVSGQGKGLISAKVTASSFHIISADIKGQIYRSKFSKGLGFSLGVFNAYSAEFDCLLNGNAGVVANSCVCQSYGEWCETHQEEVGERPKSKNSKDDEKGSSPTHRSKGRYTREANALDGVQLFAFSTNSRTYVVLMQPVIEVLYKWNHFASSSSHTISDKNGVGVDGSSVDSLTLSWSWAKQDDGSYTAHFGAMCW